MRISFKSFSVLMSLAFCFSSSDSKSQCSDLALDTMYFFTDMEEAVGMISNSGSTYIIYPFITVVSDDNPYVFINSTNVTSVLDSANGPANGLSGFLCEADLLVPFEEIPDNYTVTGLLTVEDPNDASFSCTMDFSWNIKPGVLNTRKTDLSDQIHIFPNPAAEGFQIESIKQFSQLILFDSHGVIVRQTNPQADQNRVDVSDLPSGNYILELFDGKTRVVEKLIVE